MGTEPLVIIAENDAERALLLELRRARLRQKAKRHEPPPAYLITVVNGHIQMRKTVPMGVKKHH